MQFPISSISFRKAVTGQQMSTTASVSRDSYWVYVTITGPHRIPHRQSAIDDFFSKERLFGILLQDPECIHFKLVIGFGPFSMGERVLTIEANGRTGVFLFMCVPNSLVNVAGNGSVLGVTAQS